MEYVAVNRFLISHICILAQSLSGAELEPLPPAKFTGVTAAPENISAVAVIGNGEFLVIGGDEGAEIEVLRRTGDGEYCWIVFSNDRNNDCASISRPASPTIAIWIGSTTGTFENVRQDPLLDKVTDHCKMTLQSTLISTFPKQENVPYAHSDECKKRS